MGVIFGSCIFLFVIRLGARENFSNGAQSNVTRFVVLNKTLQLSRICHVF